MKSAGRPVKGGPLFCAALLLTIASPTAAALETNDTNSPGSSVDLARPPSVLANEQCATASGAMHEPVQIHRVSDGDTIVLSDGRKVRIIGINAPELSKKSESALRADAEAAREFVEQLAADSTETTLVVGEESVDRYGRVLAHVFFDKQRSLAAELLARGLAAASAVSPNTRCAELNQHIEHIARQQRQGVWQNPNNPWFGKTVPAKSIKGFHILTAVVKTVRKRKQIWDIELSNGVLIRAKTSLLPENEANKLTNKTIEVRGWFGQNNNFTSVRLHHRINLTVHP